MNQSDQSYFESILILELLKEFKNICWQRKVKLKPSLIEFFDSQTKWGQFDPLTQTISISRNLIHNHSWHDILGVLKHEMAHQLVLETYLANKNQTNNRSNVDMPKPTDHGVEFKKACDQLGVPAKFRSAGFKSEDSEADQETLNPIIDKVKKLLSLSEVRPDTHNEHEASLAAQKARELFIKYNLNQIQNETTLENFDLNQFDHLVIETGKKKLSLSQKKLMSILSEYYFVKVLIVSYFNLKTLQYEQGIELIGLKENRLMAEYVYHFLNHSIEVMTKKNKNQSQGRRQNESIRLGLLDGFKSKLDSDFKNMNLSKDEKALIILQKPLNDYFSWSHPRLKSVKTSGRHIDRDLYNSGFVQGQKLQLNKALFNQKTASPSSSRQLLLEKSKL